jgi:hypothetical protein
VSDSRIAESEANMKGQRFQTRSPQTTPSPPSERGIFSRVTARPDIEDLRNGDGGHRGWWEMSAADGYKLRCESIVRTSDEEQLNFSEVVHG